MIDISKLVYEKITQGDNLRYASDVHRKPIVVWNSTRRCNLSCIHCYADSTSDIYPGELTTEEAKQLILGLAEYRAPVFLFSGGEPFMRGDLFELIEFVNKHGIRPVISTNGTLIDEKTAKKLKEVNIGYVGISLDGIGEVNDKFRGMDGAFEKSKEGFKNCVNAKVKVGLRLTLTKQNLKNLPQIFDFIRDEKINRACFYHLVYCGRGSDMTKDDLTHDETREAVDYIVKRTGELLNENGEVDILTVDNHTDGVYIYKKILEEDPKRASEIYRLLKINGGNSSGIGIACIDNLGNVFADQFMRNHSFGNIRERKFSKIWEDTSNPIMAGLKDRKKLLKSKCGICKYVDICNGNFRARAEAVYGDIWETDPQCYLSELEVTS